MRTLHINVSQSIPFSFSLISFVFIGVKLGCESTVCKDTPCPAHLFCYDKWRKRECISRPCDSRPCKNGAQCTDHVLKGVATFKCKCRHGFNGTQCERGASVTMLAADAEKINLKLVIGKNSSNPGSSENYRQPGFLEITPSQAVMPLVFILSGFHSLQCQATDHKMRLFWK